MTLGVFAIVAGMSLTTPPVHAQGYSAMSCGQLWYERNSIFAQYGYCFRTQQGISAFGRGCFPPYGRLPPGAQRRVNDIIAWERRRGCTG